MLLWMPFARGDETFLIFMGLIFGGGALWGVVHSLAENWRKAKISEHQAVVKQQMLDRGFSADEIERVLAAGSGGRKKPPHLMT